MNKGGSGKYLDLPKCFNEDVITIKTNMSKAYMIMLNGIFLEELFLRLDFHKKWIEWIMFCIRSVTYYVLVNGNAHGFIKPGRRICQGDPLSPFTFILCVETLVHVMNKAGKEGCITGMRLTKKSHSVQHLLFADDSLFLCRKNLWECTELLHFLNQYGAVSGKGINFQKSAVTYGEKIDLVMS